MIRGGYNAGIKKKRIMKKEYMKPAMKVVELRHKCQILAGSIDEYGMNNSVQSDEVDEGW